MKRLLAICLFVFCIPLSANAKVQRHPLGTLATATLDASSTTVTIGTADLSGFGILTLYFKLTWNAASAISMTCTASPDGGTTDYKLQTCDIASGACTSYNSSWSKSVSASTNWAWRIDTLGFPEIECVITDTGGGASDTLVIAGFVMDQ